MPKTNLATRCDGLIPHRPITGLLLTLSLVSTVVVGVAGPASGAEPQPRPGYQRVADPLQSFGTEVSRLRIPAIGVDETIRAGVDLSVIDLGVAHWVGTARPGEDGNVVLAGHRVTHSAPFVDLDRLEPGDLIYLDNGAGFDVMYRVTETLIVEPTAIWISYETPEPTVTLFACHPKGSVRHRIVVRGVLVGGGGIA